MILYRYTINDYALESISFLHANQNHCTKFGCGDTFHRDFEALSPLGQKTAYGLVCRFQSRLLVVPVGRCNHVLILTEFFSAAILGFQSLKF